MTDTVFISSSNALGSFWTSKRYFDYLIDETSLPLLRGREFGQAVLICPSLWEGRRAIRRNEEAFISHVRQLIDILHEVKIERLTYVTSIDTQPETGNEDSPLVHEFEDAFLSALAELRDYVNLKFGRVLSVYLPEVTGTGADVEKAWECGLFAVNLVPEPVTAFELAEACFPSLVGRLPVAKEADPYGSGRTSVHSTQYHDPDTGYIMGKGDVLEGISRGLQA